eukprot:TRINITY_DN609_c0_g2_i3.p4 TRINITY_DN609_c0_g2~~TRINITY_DN609_c0_g2_i3.p4  ORF type:complete len:102 (-),score=2.00 TRINITY_DN609_c0_g2_i3:61-366(-)
MCGSCLHFGKEFQVVLLNGFRICIYQIFSIFIAQLLHVYLSSQSFELKDQEGIGWFVVCVVSVWVFGWVDGKLIGTVSLITLVAQMGLVIKRIELNRIELN